MPFTSTICPTMTTYETLTKSIFQLPRMGAKLSLDNITLLADALNNPQNQYSTIHVGGTNGKGSCATKIARALSVSGKKVGLFTSPHIETFRERFLINGEMISEHEVVLWLPEVIQAAKSLKRPFSFFELVTALAFLYFAKKKVDVAVVEVGLGGRLDATNIITPLLAVITSLGLDHTEILGASLDVIAKEKGGIIKPGRPVVLGPRAQHEVLKKRASVCESPCHPVGGSFSCYEQENRATAKKALEVLGVEASFIEKGLLATPPCRFEVCEAPFPLVLDVAHNLMGLKSLFARLEKEFPKTPFRVVAAFCSDKPVESMVDFILEKSPFLHLTEVAYPRVLKVDALNMQRDHMACSSSLKKSLELAINEAQKKGEGVVVCGTFFIMSAARHLFATAKKRGTWFG